MDSVNCVEVLSCKINLAVICKKCNIKILHICRNKDILGGKWPNPELHVDEDDMVSCQFCPYKEKHTC